MYKQRLHTRKLYRNIFSLTIIFMAFEKNIGSSETSTEEVKFADMGIFKEYFKPRPPLTEKERQKKEEEDNKEINERFLNGLTEHIVTGVGEEGTEEGFTYTEKYWDSRDGETDTYIVLSKSPLGGEDTGSSEIFDVEDAEIFLLIRTGKGNKELDLANMSDEVKRNFYNTGRDIIKALGIVENPNNVDFSRRSRQLDSTGKPIDIGSQEDSGLTLAYILKGSGAGIDAVKEAKKEIGSRNRK